MRKPFGCVLVAMCLISGCERRPSAPALEDGTAYRDANAGFRFLVPNGWKQAARGSVPPGKIEGERMLVEYKCLTCASPGTLQVTVADVPTDSVLSKFLLENNRTGEKWRLVGSAEDFEINDVPAARITYSTTSGKDQSFREIVAIRRGERVYFFKGSYGGTDAQSRQAIRKAIDTIVW